MIDGTDNDWTDTYRFRRADGSYADIKDRGSVIRDEHGQATRMIGAMLDQSEVRSLLRQLESRALGLAEQVKIRTVERDRLWEATSDLMGTAGIDGYLREVNPAWQRLLGWTEAELLAEPFLALVDPADHATTADVVARLATGETIKNFVDRVRVTDGSYRTIMWDAVPDGELFYIVGRDLTEQRAIEDRLRQAQKMEAVGQLTGGIAHDFNNMLTGIIGSLDLLKRDMAIGRGDRVERYMDAASTSAQRAAGLTQRLLAFSRRQSLDVQSVDVNRLVIGMEDLLRRTLGEDTGLEIKLHASPWPARTDSNQLESALLNLAINARDAMPHGGRLTIETATTRLDERYVASIADEVSAGDFVVVSVSDTGEGMAPDVIAKAFDPLLHHQADRPGHRARPVDDLRLRAAVGRPCAHLFGDRQGHDGEALSAACRYSRRRRGKPAGGARAGRSRRMRAGRRGRYRRAHARRRCPRIARLWRARGGGRACGAAADRNDDPRRSAHHRCRPARSQRPPGRRDRAGGNGPSLPVLFVTGYAEQAAVRGGFLDEGMEMITKPFAIDALSAKIRAIIGRAAPDAAPRPPAGDADAGAG